MAEQCLFTQTLGNKVWVNTLLEQHYLKEERDDKTR